MVKFSEPYFELVIVGKKSGQFAALLQKDFYPNILWAHSATEAEIPLFKNRFRKGKTFIYVCEEGSCKLPVESVKDAKKMMLKTND